MKKREDGSRKKEDRWLSTLFRDLQPETWNLKPETRNSKRVPKAFLRENLKLETTCSI